ncbi:MULTISPECIES: hypothetical protein [unclassified Bartonella]|uniref:hypothetical protein n=1 Tax=unclassified Bartonella TaxID=2645622 RepID=UPI0035CFEFC9
MQYAIDQGLTHHEAVSEFERFTNYWIANPGKKCKQTRLAKDWVQLGYTSKVFFLAQKKARLEQEKRLGGHYGNDQSGVSIDFENWEYIDETGGSANLRCLQSSTSVALCESFS